MMKCITFLLIFMIAVSECKSEKNINTEIYKKSYENCKSASGKIIKQVKVTFNHESKPHIALLSYDGTELTFYKNNDSYMEYYHKKNNETLVLLSHKLGIEVNKVVADDSWKYLFSCNDINS